MAKPKHPPGEPMTLGNMRRHDQARRSGVEGATHEGSGK